MMALTCLASAIHLNACLFSKFRTQASGMKTPFLRIKSVMISL